ncbi:hypothetical protein [Streptomyces nodosus]|uniref:hypothetical protein n=1 Tax=Streptomyces nodosus TaxID=40318 RepID=UPI0036F04B24
MSDHQQPHQADEDRVAGQNAVTDFTRSVEKLPEDGFFGFNRMLRAAVLNGSPVGQALRTSRRTNFEGHQLNEMIDLVERTNPEDLESSGRALWDARDAIKAAASELNGHIDKVHWVGESGEAFRTWGAGLVKHADALGDFAGTAGDQLSAAAIGLASVRSSMPPRDSRSDPRAVGDFPKSEQVDSNDKYTAAVKVEKHRQEAINQMNRLSSYYVVSEERLAALEPPKFESMPNVGVPEPAGRDTVGDRGGAGTPTTRTGGERPVVPGHHPVAAEGQARRDGFTDGAAPPHMEVDGPVDRPRPDARTNIDSVDVLPERKGEAVRNVPPTVSTPPAAGDRPLPPSVTGYTKPVANSSSARGFGSDRARTPLSAKGKPSAPTAGPTGPARGAAPRVTGPFNQPHATGQAGTKGGTPGPSQAATRRGISGGTPRTGGAAVPRASGGGTTGAARGNGVVGGKPATGKGGPDKPTLRVPRGTVVGGAGPKNGAPASADRTGRRGVIGAPGTKTSPGEEAARGRGPQGGGEAVTGKPAKRNSAAKAKKGFTPGGSGLLGRLAGNRRASDRERPESKRPAAPAEEENAHRPNTPRRDVPPETD